MSTGNQGSIQTFLSEIDWVVYGFGLGVSVLAIIGLIAAPEAAKGFINDSFSYMTGNFAWF